MTCQSHCVWDLKATLGEGPIWLPSERCVWFVDIKSRLIHRFDPQTSTARSWSTPEQPGFIAPLRCGAFLVGLKSGLHRFDPATGAFTLVAAIEPDLPGNRLNDGYVDIAGRVWFGSMDDGERDATGALYCLRNGRTVTRLDAGYCITNGPAVTPDGRTLYHTCTTTRTVYAFDVFEDGMVANRRIFLQLDGTQGYPDGSIVDAEGCLWIALWGGWAMQRYSPSAEALERIVLPCAQITKAAFGGDDLRMLYITTARKGLDSEQLAAQPQAGGLFAARVDVPGQPQYATTLD